MNKKGVSGVVVTVLLVLVGLAAIALVSFFVIDFSKEGLGETSTFEGFGDEGQLLYSEDEPLGSEAPSDDGNDDGDESNGGGGSSGSGDSGDVINSCEIVVCADNQECVEGHCHYTGDDWIPITQCDDISNDFFNIRESGNYYLANDLESTGDGTCLNIYNIGSIVLDGAGHKITGKGLDSETSAITISSATDSVFKNLFIQGYRFYGFSMGYSSNNQISNLILFNNTGKGIFLHESSENSFSEINASYNSFSGISLYLSENNEFSDIIANNNTAGLMLQSSSNNEFSDIIANNNSRAGIVLFKSSSNNEFSDIIANNNPVGFYLLESSDNNIILESTACDNIENDIYCASSSGLSGSDNYLDSMDNCGEDISYSSCSIVVEEDCIDNCGVTITESGDYCIGNDLISSGEDCIVVSNVDNVNIDGREYSITGGGSGNGILFEDVGDSSITNLIISNFENGIYLDGSLNSPDRNELSKLALDENTVGLKYEGSYGFLKQILVTNSVTGVLFSGKSNELIDVISCNSDAFDLYCINLQDNFGVGNSFDQISVACGDKYNNDISYSSCPQV